MRQIGYREDLRHAAQTPALERQAARNAAQETMTNSGRHPVERRGKLIEHVLRIAAELFVGALSTQHHAHVLFRLAAHEIGGYPRRLAHRFVINPSEEWQLLGKILEAYRDFVVLRAVAFRHLARVAELTELGDVESDGKGFHRCRNC